MVVKGATTSLYLTPDTYRDMDAIKKIHSKEFNIDLSYSQIVRLAVHDYAKNINKIRD